MACYFVKHIDLLGCHITHFQGRRPCVLIGEASKKSALSLTAVE
jgi:hypothetical protein